MTMKRTLTVGQTGKKPKFSLIISEAEKLIELKFDFPFASPKYYVERTEFKMALQTLADSL